MNLISQVCNLDLSKQLHELGVRVESIFVHIIEDGGNHRLVCLFQEFKYLQIRYAETYPAYTVSELGLMLPDEFISLKSCEEWLAFEVFSSPDGSLVEIPYCDSKTEADCRAKALIYCIENGLVKVEDINNDPS